MWAAVTPARGWYRLLVQVQQMSAAWPVVAKLAHYQMLVVSLHGLLVGNCSSTSFRCNHGNSRESLH